MASRVFTNPVRNKNILIALVQKDLKDRYASSALGFIWLIFQPLSIILVYTIVFSLVFRTSIPDSYTQVPYVIFLMCGLIPFQIFSETVGRSANILIQNEGMVTKMVFPYDLFPVSILITSMITGIITLLLTVILMSIMGVAPSYINFLYLPVFVIPQMLLALGLSWILSCVTVMVRDIAHVVPVLLNLLFFATPILYSYQMVEKLQTAHPLLLLIAKLNPLYSIVIGYRFSLIGKAYVLDNDCLLITYAISVTVFLCGGFIFHYFKNNLADFF